MRPIPFLRGPAHGVVRMMELTRISVADREVMVYEPPGEIMRTANAEITVSPALHRYELVELAGGYFAYEHRGQL